MQIVPTLEKKRDEFILHISTNDLKVRAPKTIVNDIMKLKICVVECLPPIKFNIKTQ